MGINLIEWGWCPFQFMATLDTRQPKPEQKPRITAIEKSRRRARQNLQTGKKLGKVANTHKDTASEVTADLLKLSAHEKASGELTNFRDKNGRVFNCPYSFISAHTILDANYQNRTARRHRKTIYEAFKRHLPDIIEHSLDVSFLTPTFPNLLGIGFDDNDKFQTRAWELFLQTKVFADFFYAGYSKTESTLGNKATREKEKRAFDLKLDGINYHCHALCINYKPFADGNTPDIENELLAMRKNGKTAMETRPLRNSLRVVSAWTKCVKRAHKEIFGKSLRIKTNSHRARFSFQSVPLNQIKEFNLDESRNGIFWEIAKAANYTGKAASFRDLPPELLLEAENVFRNKRLINPFGAFRKYVQKDESDTDHLVNQSTQQTKNTPPTPRKWLSVSDLRGKNEPLKTYGIRLCEQGKRRVWLAYLKENIHGIIEKRRDALLERFPHAVFTDLSGKSYTIHDCRRKFQLTTLAHTDNGAWYSARIPSRQSPGVLEELRQLERGVSQPVPLEADASVRTPSKPITPRYPLPDTAPTVKAKRLSNWDIFNSFCDLGSDTERENKFR
jgi:hypothetical protein